MKNSADLLWLCGIMPSLTMLTSFFGAGDLFQKRFRHVATRLSIRKFSGRPGHTIFIPFTYAAFSWVGDGREKISRRGTSRFLKAQVKEISYRELGWAKIDLIAFVQ